MVVNILRIKIDLFLLLFINLSDYFMFCACMQCMCIVASIILHVKLQSTNILKLNNVNSNSRVWHYQH